MTAELAVAFCQTTPILATKSSDLLSDIFRSACPRCRVVETLQFTSPWSFRVNANSVAFYYVLQGGCRLDVTDADADVSLAAGDLVVVIPGREHSLRDSGNSPAIPLREVPGINATRMRRGATLDGEGRSTSLICCSVVFDERQVVPLLVSLPPVVVVQDSKEEGVPRLDQMLKTMIHESDECLPGSQSVIDHLAQVVFIQAVRRCVNMPCSGGGNRLAALMDPDIGLALKVMHTCLDSPWTVAELAHRASLSRSAFASRFKALLSMSPIQYLTERRMQKACELLAEGRYGIKQIASRVGYASKTAFSNAFKRWSGQSPQAYRRRPPKTLTYATGRGPGGR
ncbi:MAG: AraC family transcriptional regulator [Thermoguttaceae bacterium]